MATPDLTALPGLALRLALTALARAAGVGSPFGLRVVARPWASVGASCVLIEGAARHVDRWIDAGPVVFAETADEVLVLWAAKRRSAEPD
ncbi:MAG: hypothetical protein Q8S73_05835 [Deltaproteobacteria bacterium]|nr:hypothetical protein [Myxococcales bacterium]MDP3213603.1 hypothetical protein [Deltaproteobacteria bacterium]